MTTRARASLENWREKVRARGAGMTRPLSRGGADEDAPPAPGGYPRSPGPVVARRYARLRHRHSRSVRMTRPTADDRIAAKA
jgi:hypothetical protein